MVAIGMAMAALGIWSLWLRWRQTLYDERWAHRAALLMGPMGFVAVLAGWITTEVGRQPFTVYGLLRTSESISPIAAEGVAVSLAAFTVVYSIVFVTGVRYMLILMNRPPIGAAELHADEGPTRSGGMMAAAKKIEEGHR
jgi:cytochrome d ubiquinol oxidase subunit I